MARPSSAVAASGDASGCNPPGGKATAGDATAREAADRGRDA